MTPPLIRPAQLSDLDDLAALENACFSCDRLSRRSFRHWLSVEHWGLLVAEQGRTLCGYILIIDRPGTRLARIYSLAVAPEFRGLGIAKSLLLAGEQAALADGRFYLRLEVGVDNAPAIKLYDALGFQRFGIHRDYYQDHTDAIRLQKRIRHYSGQSQQRPVRWLRQTTPFTCGPAALMMAMHALDSAYSPSQEEEINLWREATTIFMTSGHGGCHPLGLALSAKRRRFAVEVWINQAGPLFVDSVRNEEKKQVVSLVDTCFKREAEAENIKLNYANITQNELIAAFKDGAIPLLLISTFAMDRKKTPHWLVMSGFDDDCIYMHDSDPEEGLQNELDCQFIPVAKEELDRMSCFGKSRLRTAVIIRALSE
ncbi:MAG: GNAT family N-acetyltransferase/peptidase C39 family protein [Methylomonas sp.]|jgi:ribosomal protein S18 acetylase RimI-like enzyme